MKKANLILIVLWLAVVASVYFCTRFNIGAELKLLGVFSFILAVVPLCIMSIYLCRYLYQKIEEEYSREISVFFWFPCILFVLMVFSLTLFFKISEINLTFSISMIYWIIFVGLEKKKYIKNLKIKDERKIKALGLKFIMAIKLILPLKF